MTTLVFVSLLGLNCQGNRCTYGAEVIVRAQDMKKLTSFQYKLGPIANTINEGCLVETVDGSVYKSGKPCREHILGGRK